MKLLFRFLLCVAICQTSGLMVTSAANADIIYEFGDSFNNGAFGLESTNSTRDGIEFFQNGDQTTTSLFFNDFALTDSATGVQVTFDFTFSPASAGVTDIAATVGTANSSLTKQGGTFFTGGDIIDITFSDLQVLTPGATANFLGFVDIGTDNNGNNIGEGINVDGTSYTRGGTPTPSTYGNENDPRQGIHGGDVDNNFAATGLPFFQTGNTTTVEFLGNALTLRGVAFAIETTVPVPEPSSAVLICVLGTIGMIRRRR